MHASTAKPHLLRASGGISVSRLVSRYRGNALSRVPFSFRVFMQECCNAKFAVSNPRIQNMIFVNRPASQSLPRQGGPLYRGCYIRRR